MKANHLIFIARVKDEAKARTVEVDLNRLKRRVAGTNGN
jgi:hypothetical protein